MDAYDYTPIIVTERNVIQDTNGSFNTLSFELQQDTTVAPYTDICFIEGSLYYSWPNITVKFNNNSFEYYWINDQIKVINMPDGMYNIRDIQAFLENEMVKNTHYLEYINPQNPGDRKKMFFIHISVNLAQLVATITITPVPTQEQCTANDLVKPTDATWNLPGPVPFTPILYIPTYNNFGKLLGFNPGIYPPTNPARYYLTTYNSQFAPQIQPQTTILLSCNLIQNDYLNNGLNNDVVFAFTPTVGFSELQPLSARTQVWSNIKSGSYRRIQFKITDQNRTPLNIIDPTIMFVFLIRRLRAT